MKSISPTHRQKNFFFSPFLPFFFRFLHVCCNSVWEQKCRPSYVKPSLAGQEEQKRVRLYVAFNNSRERLERERG